MFKVKYNIVANIIIISLLLNSVAYAGITFYDEDENETIKVQETKKRSGIDLDALIEAEEKKKTTETTQSNKKSIMIEMETTAIEETQNITVKDENVEPETIEIKETEKIPETTVKKQEEPKQVQIMDSEQVKQSQELVQALSEKEKYKQLFNAYYDKYTAAAANSQVEYSYKGVWIVENGYWVYYLENAKKLKDSWLDYGGSRYWLDNEGHMTVGFKFIDGHWYFFNRDGKMHSGWLEYNSNIKYYFDPITGWMAQNTTTIDGQVCTFAADGRLIMDNTEEDIIRLVQGIQNKIKYVDNNTDRKTCEVEQDNREYVRKILQWLPKDTLQVLYDNNNLTNIYICMKQDKGKKDEDNRPYIWRISYYTGETYENENGKTVKERTTENIPFRYDQKELVIEGENPEILFFGIGHVLAYCKKFNGKSLKDDPNWKVLFKNQEEKDHLMSFSGDRGLISYVGREDVCLATAIAWYYIDYVQFKENCPVFYKYVNSVLKPSGYSNVGPSTISNAQLYVNSIDDIEQLKKIIVAPIAENELPQLTEEEKLQERLKTGENWICSNPDCLKININDGDYCRFCGQKKTSTTNYKRSD